MGLRGTRGGIDSGRSLSAGDVPLRTGAGSGRRHEVLFNGVRVDGLEPGLNPHYYLRTDSCDWVVSRFQIPLGKVKFPSARGAGGPPVPQPNEVRILFDAQPDCVGVASAWLKIKVMSPIVLIHGNNSDGEFFLRRGLTFWLDELRLLYDSSIDLPTAPVEPNAVRLGLQVPGIIQSFGVDSVHLVAHSKGGLDTRDYLAQVYPDQRDAFDILTLITLGTPHDGSVLADIAESVTVAAKAGRFIQFHGLPEYTSVLAGILDPDDGQRDLTTWRAYGFNRENTCRLPRDMVYCTAGGDADKNGNLQIDNQPDEYWEIRAEEAKLRFLFDIWPERARRLVNDRMYQVLGRVQGIEIHTYSLNGPLTAIWSGVAISGSPRRPNDLLVTTESALGTGSYHQVVDRVPYVSRKNHAGIADQAVGAQIIVPWVVETERSDGDLK